MRLCILTAALFVLGSPAMAQNCTVTGNNVFCDNGLSAVRSGNSTFWNDGTSSI
jgi:hypothetical protein